MGLHGISFRVLPKCTILDGHPFRRTMAQIVFLCLEQRCSTIVQNRQLSCLLQRCSCIMHRIGKSLMAIILARGEQHLCIRHPGMQTLPSIEQLHATLNLFRHPVKAVAHIRARGQPPLQVVGRHGQRLLARKAAFRQGLTELHDFLSHRRVAGADSLPFLANLLHRIYGIKQSIGRGCGISLSQSISQLITVGISLPLVHQLLHIMRLFHDFVQICPIVLCLFTHPFQAEMVYSHPVGIRLYRTETDGQFTRTRHNSLHLIGATFRHGSGKITCHQFHTFTNGRCPTLVHGMSFSPKHIRSGLQSFQLLHNRSIAQMPSFGSRSPFLRIHLTILGPTFFRRRIIRLAGKTVVRPSLQTIRFKTGIDDFLRHVLTRLRLCHCHAGRSDCPHQNSYQRFSFHCVIGLYLHKSILSNHLLLGREQN